METPVSLGVTILAIATLIYIFFAASTILIFDKKTVWWGLLGILAAVSISWTLALLMEGTRTGQAIDTLLIAPLFSLTASIALAVRYGRKLKNKSIWMLIRTSLRTNWLRALNVFGVSSLVYFTIATLLHWPMYLHAPLILGGLWALLTYLLNGPLITKPINTKNQK